MVRSLGPIDLVLSMLSSGSWAGRPRTIIFYQLQSRDRRSATLIITAGTRGYPQLKGPPANVSPYKVSGGKA